MGGAAGQAVGEGVTVRLAILSDVHANLQALNAVLSDVRCLGAERIVCLGDLVGYGPEPAEVLQQAYARIGHFVLGNHDAVIAGLMDPAVFNPSARQMIAWTASRLNPKAAKFLAGLPYVLTGRGFRCCHGNPASPAAFGYVLDDAHAREAWQATTERFLFIGHSHVPGLFVLGRSGTPHWLEPQDFGWEEGKRYIVNVGSVGQPRDGDVQASYCLFDDTRGEVFFRRVPFDLDSYRQALARTAAPIPRTYFLTIADRGQPRPLREILDFHPLSPEQVAGRPVTEAQLGRAVRAARRWRVGTAVLLVTLVAVLSGAGYLWRRAQPAMVEFAARRQAPLALPACGTGCLPGPGRAGPVSAEAPLEDWTMRLADPGCQQVEVCRDDPAGTGGPVFHLRSEKPLPLALESRPLLASRGMRFQVQAAGRAGPSFQGYAEVALVVQGADGIERPLVHCPLERLSADRWKAFRRSAPAQGLRDDASVRWVLRGEFAGELLLRDLELRRTK